MVHGTKQPPWDPLVPQRAPSMLPGAARALTAVPLRIQGSSPCSLVFSSNTGLSQRGSLGMASGSPVSAASEIFR